MDISTEIVALDTKAGFGVVDITDRVERLVDTSRLDFGSVALFVVGSTAALTTVEYEPGLVADLEALFEAIAPESGTYRHDERWHDGNGHSHVRASLVGPSLVIPFLNGRLTLGQWQQVVLIDLDVPSRHREIICQIMGKRTRE
ncbi:MAG: YjbQ family protein [Planctomycetes bacterium]|nr:YjbQ family protein [Planctomycetota bacterium]